MRSSANAVSHRKVRLKEGFASAVTAEASPIYPQHRHRMHSLPRIAVRPDETAETLYYRASGLSWAMNAHKRRRLAHA